MVEQNSKASVRRCSILSIFQGVTTKAASNPTKVVGQFLDSDVTLLRRGRDGINLRCLFTCLG